MVNNRPTPDRLEEVHPEEFPHAEVDLGHGDVLIAAITSCTNTSNPSVMLAAGLAGKESCRAWLDSALVGEKFAGARLARGD